MIFCRMIVRERAFGPCWSGPPLRGEAAGPSVLRDATTKSTFSGSLLDIQQKMAAKLRFWVIGKRDFLRDPKKYTFGKSIFKTFCKNQKTQILPPFLSTSDSWTSSGFVENGISKWRSKKIFLRSDPSGPRSTYTTNQTINRLICNRIVDSLL